MGSRVGVAFGGGGARGLAHVGVIRALRARPRFAPGIVAGTSVGSIAALLMASGLEQPRLEELARGFDWFRNVIRFSDTVRSFLGRRVRGGLVSNAGLGDTMNRLIGGRTFDDLELDAAVVATDLEGRRRVIFTGRRVARRLSERVLERYLPRPSEDLPGCETVVVDDLEDVGLAVRCSCAVPGLFQPVVVRGMRLVDGGLVDQVPVDVARAMGARYVVGVSLALGPYPVKLTNAAAAVAGSVSLMGFLAIRRSLEMADIGFQIPGIEERSLVDTHQLDLIDLGERETSRRLDGARRPQARRGAGRR